jgi:Fe-S cluster assembly ATP-binding protein
MLEINKLTVEVSGKTILKDMHMTINAGEVVILFGPNGSGKSTLVKTVLGLQGYAVKSGEMFFKGKKINDMPTDQRVKLGMGVMFQNPPKIRGVTLRQIARYLSGDEQKIKDLAEELSLTHMLDRDINFNFSGGEIKRSELFQLLLQDPDFVFLDEPESGVDIENVALMGNVLNNFLHKDGKAALIITHTGYVLDFIEAKRGCVMLNGKFWCLGNPKEIFKRIQQSGYEECISCHDRQGI